MLYLAEQATNHFANFAGNLGWVLLGAAIGFMGGFFVRHKWWK